MIIDLFCFFVAQKAGALRVFRRQGKGYPFTYIYVKVRNTILESKVYKHE